MTRKTYKRSLWRELFEWIFGQVCAECEGFGWYYIDSDAGTTEQCEVCLGKKRVR